MYELCFYKNHVIGKKQKPTTIFNNFDDYILKGQICTILQFLLRTFISLGKRSNANGEIDLKELTCRQKLLST